MHDERITDCIPPFQVGRQTAYTQNQLQKIRTRALHDHHQERYKGAPSDYDHLSFLA